MTTNTLRNPNPLPVVEPPTPVDPAVDHAKDAKRKVRLTLIPAVLGGLVLLALLLTALGIWWSFQPPKFDVVANAQTILGTESPPSVPGTVTVASAIRVAQTLLDKRGGYVKNDMTPPGALMDNLPSWEYGALTELRDSVRSLRNDFSRSQTQSIENIDLKEADSDFNFGSDAWFLPSAEEQYRQGVNALRAYLKALESGSDQTARFYIRADNLAAYLAVVEKRLGSYGQRLAASVGDPELTAVLTSAGAAGAPSLDRTSWTQIDNVFFEARGYSWALLHMMKSLSVDFEKVLVDKNAEVSMQQIIRDLEQATMFKWSPVMLNGHGYGVLANHSLVLASYIARANAAVLDLRMLLRQG
ncbi:MAG: DUF2333 family protein [Thiohalocapsa sp.]